MFLWNGNLKLITNLTILMASSITESPQSVHRIPAEGAVGSLTRNNAAISVNVLLIWSSDGNFCFCN